MILRSFNLGPYIPIALIINLFFCEILDFSAVITYFLILSDILFPLALISSRSSSYSTSSLRFWIKFSISVRTDVLSHARYSTYRGILTVHRGIPVVCLKRAKNPLKIPRGNNPKILGHTDQYALVTIEIRGVPTGSPR